MVARPQGSLSFVHAADLHLDTPFTGVQADAPVVASALREASLETLDRIIDLAIAESVDFVLLAGDIYDGAERGIRAQSRLRDAMVRLDRVGIQAFLVHGNHDPIESGWSAISENWPANVTIFGSDSAQVCEIWRDGERIATVQGISYREHAVTENLSLHLHRPNGPGIHIGLLHANVEGGPSGHSNYSPCTIEDLVTTELDYLALGHVHERRILLEGDRIGTPWIVYPGNTQARSAIEQGARGVYLVRAEGGTILPPTFVACDGVRFATIEVDVTPSTSLLEIEDLCRERVDLFREENPHHPLIIRTVLQGRTALHESLSAPGVLEEILATLRHGGAQWTPFLWWDRLDSATLPDLDLDELESRDDFVGALLTAARSLAVDPDRHLGLSQSLIAAIPQHLRRELRQRLADRESLEMEIASAKLIALDALLGER
jgi:DNA repair exonuclease SbcCD nuclease subunit